MHRSTRPPQRRTPSLPATRWRVAAALLVAAACGGDGPTGSGGNPPEQPPPGQTVGSVVIGGGTRAMSAGDTAWLAARVFDGAGQALADSAARWSSLDAPVATVSKTGVVQTLAPGTARIVAASGARADTAVFTVVPTRRLYFRYSGDYSGVFDAAGPLVNDAAGHFTFRPMVEAVERPDYDPPYYAVQALATHTYPLHDTFYMQIDQPSVTRERSFPFDCGRPGEICAHASIVLGASIEVNGGGNGTWWDVIEGRLQITRMTPRLVEGTFSGVAWNREWGTSAPDADLKFTITDGRFSIPRCPTPNTWSMNCEF